MTRIHRSCGAVALALTFATSSANGGSSEPVKRLEAHQLAQPYHADCEAHDLACLWWADFRAHRPYPHQGIAVGQLPDQTAVVILSEPPPSNKESDLLNTTALLFGSDLLDSRVRRWLVAEDGWVKDVVLHVKTRKTSAAANSDLVLAARLAFLESHLFGTTFGSEVLDLGDPALAPVADPELDVLVTPKELKAWLDQPTRTWKGLGEFETPLTETQLLLEGKSAGVFISSDATLVAIRLPDSFFDVSPSRELNTRTKRLLRHFTLASDLIIGGVWNDSAAVVFARARKNKVATLPPLRGEMIQLLAAVDRDELAQSFERTHMLAGEFESDRDWAPIHLSPSLVDTEFGLLLDITDQMLKSWSDAGEVQYRRFSYSMTPTRFPFDGKSLWDIATTELGATSVLYNWNTDGVGVLVDRPDLKFYVNGRTGALPVTYGVGRNSAQEDTGTLLRYEEEGYDYFAGLGDPNLVRVQQYSALFQFFRAFREARGLGSGSEASAGFVSEDRVCKYLASASSTKILYLPMLINDPEVDAVMSGHPDMSAADWGSYLGCPNIELSKIQRDIRVLKQRAPEVADLMHRALRYPGVQVDYYRLLAARQQLSRNEFLADGEALLERIAAFSSANRLSRRMSGLLVSESHLREVVRLAAHRQSGWIRTPSVVVSWNQGERTGGHNIDSSAVRLKPSQSVPTLEVVADADGKTTVLYNPRLEDQVASSARRLARQVQHRKLTDGKSLAWHAEDAPVRSPRDALRLHGASRKGGQPPLPPRPPRRGTTSPGDWSGRLGSRSYSDKKGFLKDLRGLAETDDCCIYVARDSLGQNYVVERVPEPGRGTRVTEVRDAMALRRYLRDLAKSETDVVFLEYSVREVEALTASMSADAEGQRHWARWLGSQRSRVGFEESTGAVLLRTEGGARSVLGLSRSRAGAKRRSFKRLNAWLGVWLKRTAKPAKVNRKRFKRILDDAGWDASRDGQPTAVAWRMESVDRGTFTTEVVAGFEKGGTSRPKRVLNRAVKRAWGDPKPGRTLRSFVDRLKAELRKLEPSVIKRFKIIIRSRTDEAHFSQRLRAGWSSACA